MWATITNGDGDMVQNRIRIRRDRDGLVIRMRDKTPQSSHPHLLQASPSNACFGDLLLLVRSVPSLAPRSVGTVAVTVGYMRAVVVIILIIPLSAQLRLQLVI